jgi:hypothetical protein
MPVSRPHGQVAAIALRAAARHGFAVGGDGGPGPVTW